MVSCSLFCAAIPEYHSAGNLQKTEIYFPRFWSLGSPKSRQAGFFSGGAILPFQDGALPAVSSEGGGALDAHMAEGEELS